MLAHVSFLRKWFNRSKRVIRPWKPLASVWGGDCFDTCQKREG
ncbi:hypothetical protein PA257_0534 [Pseudomonas aeruginosa]|nr:hypothetical protein PA257_0534 [Pseudomonas aeruginosa]